MKIWNANKMKDDCNKMIALFKNNKADISYLTKLQQIVNFNKEATGLDVAAIFMLASVCEQVAIRKEPNVLIMAMEGDTKSALEQFEKTLLSPIYSEIKQNAYISLILSKPNGREFAEGSLKYTDEEYKVFNKTILREIASYVDEVNKLTGMKLNAVIPTSM